MKKLGVYSLLATTLALSANARADFGDDALTGYKQALTAANAANMTKEKVEIEHVAPANATALEALITGLRPQANNIPTLRLIALKYPHSADADLVTRIRDRAEAIAGRDKETTNPWDKGFIPTRERIHNHFQPAVLDETKAYYARNKGNLSAPAQAEFETLIRDMEILFGLGTGQKNVSVEQLVSMAEVRRGELAKESKTVNVLMSVDELNRKLGDLFVRLGDATALPRKGSVLPMSMLEALLRTLHAEGLLSDKDRDRFVGALGRIDGKSRKDDLMLRDFLRHVFAVAQEKLEKDFKWMRAKNRVHSSDEDQSQFIQNQIRSSSLLRLSRWIELLGEQNPRKAFEASSEGSRCGTLRVVESEAQLEKLATGMNDILAVISDKPVEVTRKTPFGGLLANNPMTEGSHAVILCRNMQRPCGAAALSKEESARIKKLNGSLVRLDVKPEGYKLQKAVAEPKRTTASTQKRIALEKNLAINGVQDMSGKATATSIGVKAANYFDLTKLLGKDRTQPGMAIPFSHYVDYMKVTGTDKVVTEMLKDPRLTTDPAYRKQTLEGVRNRIKQGTVPAWLVDQVRAQINARFKDSKGLAKRLRFRSSSNSEDLKWFSGAGLYDSVGLAAQVSGETDSDYNARIAQSIKDIWASVWSDNAFEGREEVGIDHSTVAMGILINPSYENENGNGVALTGSGPQAPDRYRVSVNFNDYAVTNPEFGALPEVYEASRPGVVSADPAKWDPRTIVRRSNVQAGAPVLTNEEAEDLRQLIVKIHDHYGGPTEIEFKLMPDPKRAGKNIIQVKQARPYRPNGNKG